jgi:lambda family phage tail tape measure protein
MADIATLGIKIDSSGAKSAASDLQSLGKQAQETEQQVDRLGNSGSRVFQNFARGFAAGAIITAFAGLARAAKAFSDELVEIGNTAKRAALDVEAFQRLQFAAGKTGVSGSQFRSGAEGFAEQLNRARVEETELGKLLEANGRSIRNRNGDVIDFNTALGHVADIVRNAATEMDKIQFADKVGLTREWVPLLEKGSLAIERAGFEAERAGGIMSSSMIDAAKRFDDAATSMWNNFSTGARGAIAIAIEQLGRLISMLGAAMNAATSLSSTAPADSQFAADAARRRQNWARRGVNFYDSTGQFGNVEERIRRQHDRDIEDFERSISGTLVRGTVPEARRFGPNPGAGGRSRNPFLTPPSGGGGGGGRAEAEERETSLERETRRLEERTRAIQAHTQTIGLNEYAVAQAEGVQRLLNAALRDGDEIGKKFANAQDLLKASTESLTPALAEERQKIIDTANAYALARTKAEEAEKQNRAYTDTMNTGRSAFTGFFQDLTQGLINGKKGWDLFATAGLNALNKITSKMIEMAGNSLFNSIFGGQNAGGSGFLSGLFGFGNLGAGLGSTGTAILGNGGVIGPGGIHQFASGGVVTRPMLFPFSRGVGLLGEAGPEAILPLRRGSDGKLGVAAANSNSGTSITLQIDARGSTPDSVKELEARIPGIVVRSVTEAQRKRMIR